MFIVGFDPLGMWTMLTQGNIIGAVLSSYTNVLGVWFYFLVLLLGMVMIYMKTQNFGTTMITAMLALAGSYSAITLGAISGILPAGSEYYVGIAIALGMAVIFYKVVH